MKDSCYLCMPRGNLPLYRSTVNISQVGPKALSRTKRAIYDINFGLPIAVTSAAGEKGRLQTCLSSGSDDD